MSVHREKVSSLKQRSSTGVHDASNYAWGAPLRKGHTGASQMCHTKQIISTKTFC